MVNPMAQLHQTREPRFVEQPLATNGTETLAPRRKRIGLDLDDTVAHVKELARQHVNKEFGTDLQFSDIRIARLEENITGVTITEADMKRIFALVWSEMDRISLLDPKIPEMLQRIHQHYDITIATASDADDETLLRFLQKNKVPFDEIVHVHSSKEKLGATPHVDIYVDDYHKIAEDAAKIGKIAILIKQPWNKMFRKRGEEHHFPHLIPTRMEHLEDALRLAEALRI